MNKRIKELAKKSGFLGRKFMFGKYYDDELTDEQKKFAELVVKECLGAIQKERDSCSINQTISLGQHSGMAMSKSAIKKHFGI
jgi:hypothetical protein